MKMLIAAAAFATLVASPAFAQSYDSDLGTGNIAPYPTKQALVAQDGSNAYAQSFRRTMRGPHKATRKAHRHIGTSNAWDAYNFQGSTDATDPDPNIRFQLNRESLQGGW